ncbi:MAG: DUF3606 domain-containing protein [Dokdonella sp.]
MNQTVGESKEGLSNETRKPTTVAIDLDDSTQAAWWATHFGVTRVQLLLAILRAGCDAESVRKALGK